MLPQEREREVVVTRRRPNRPAARRAYSSQWDVLVVICVWANMRREWERALQSTVSFRVFFRFFPDDDADRFSFAGFGCLLTLHPC